MPEENDTLTIELSEMSVDRIRSGEWRVVGLSLARGELLNVIQDQFGQLKECVVIVAELTSTKR